MKLALLSMTLLCSTLSFAQSSVYVQSPAGPARLSANSISGALAPVPASDLDHLRLAVLRQQLAHLSSIYDADHPSVRKLQAQIGEVEATVAASNAAAATGTIRLRGNVEIRTTTMTLTADEADYDRQTGEIEARGTVRVKPNSK